MSSSATGYSRLLALVVLTDLMLMSTCMLYWDAQGKLKPPVRPADFHCAQEISDYLRDLHEYYALVGRLR